jgi:hypothetical protein
MKLSMMSRPFLTVFKPPSGLVSGVSIKVKLRMGQSSS